MNSYLQKTSFLTLDEFYYVNFISCEHLHLLPMQVQIVPHTFWEQLVYYHFNWQLFIDLG